MPLVMSAFVLGFLALAAVQPPSVEFERDVRPILAVCVGCHGTELAEASLRLHTRAGLLAGSSSGRVVIPGNGPESVLYQRLIADDPDVRMPWGGDPLRADQIETILRWIDEGARWPEGVVVTAPSNEPPQRPQSFAPEPDHRFNRDVRPILADCYACHGPDRNRRQAGLRLDREESAKAALPSGAFAIVPRDPEKSALLARVSDADEARRMPHVSSGKPRLTADQIGILRRWIEQGARWEPHWSYIPPKRPETLPAPSRAGWPRNPIDDFVLAAIEREGLAPSPEAARHELLRRLSFDLIGLPPTPEEVRGFLSDSSSAAYERQVDRLLASPHFGERMATYWLDLVRYSDSVGYHSDNARPLWRYRDWVVSAFNQNLPFDRFTVEQLASDLLENPTFDQKIASGYNRLLQTTEEGGAQPKEYRAIYLADRVRNVSTVWLGATLGCAQCHDHKFDPYLARDFYSFQAFFADVEEEPVGRRKPDPLLDRLDDAHRKSFEEAEAEVERLEDELKETAPDSAWEERIRATPVCWTTLEPVEARSENGTRLLIQGNDFSMIATTAAGPKPPRDTYTVRFETALHGITAFRLEAVPFEELPKGGPGRDPEGGFAVTGLVIRDGTGRTVAESGPWSLARADGDTHRLIFEAAKPPAAKSGDGGTELTLVLHQDAGAGRTLGRFRLSASIETMPVCREPGPGVSRDLLAIAGTPLSERTEEQRKEISSYYQTNAPELAPLRVRLREATLRRDELLANIPQSYVTTTWEPEPVRILPRGNWLDESGAIVEPSVPRFLPPLDVSGRRATRLDLARWLTSRENPLTARVLVNRLWKIYFGSGLSRTLEDLGSQGEWPSHPELLDWLAVELMESGWDVKHVVRAMVTSAAYRQSSRASKELLERDPDNRLFARQSRFRLDAEAVRDNALAVSGLLSPALGGPSVFPHQPPGYWAFLNFPPREWDDSAGEDQYRRGLYTWWQRSFLHPSLLAFDAPAREECAAERTRANVPQQALVLLNDPTYVEASRAFAMRIAERGGSGLEARIGWAYSRALSRPPREEEVEILSRLYEKHLAEYRGNEQAALTSVARAILNLPETITRP
jgi:cytochrome c553